jgi:hypothetical protein
MQRNVPDSSLASSTLGLRTLDTRGNTHSGTALSFASAAELSVCRNWYVLKSLPIP